MFVGKQKILKTEQGSMCPQSVQHGHEGIAFLTSFTLMDHVGVATVIGPEILGWLRIKQEHKKGLSLPRTW